jgi:hypothetical protein
MYDECMLLQGTLSDDRGVLRVHFKQQGPPASPFARKEIFAALAALLLGGHHVLSVSCRPVSRSRNSFLFVIVSPASLCDTSTWLVFVIVSPC